jgi:hypothetical protein
LQSRRDLALEPRAIALPWMLASPAMIAAMMLGVGLAALAFSLRARKRRAVFPFAVRRRQRLI